MDFQTKELFEISVEINFKKFNKYINLNTKQYRRGEHLAPWPNNNIMKATKLNKQGLIGSKNEWSCYDWSK